MSTIEIKTIQTDQAVQAAPRTKPKLGDVQKLLNPKPRTIKDMVPSAPTIKRTSKRIELDVSWGSDPETHLALANGQIISSIPVLKRDKHDPIDLGDGIRMYSDCVLVETSFPPSDTKAEMIERLKVVFTRMQEHLGDEYRLIPQAAHEYQPHELEPSYGIDPRVAGCEPSYSAWNRSINTPPDFQGGLRSGSFHIHLGHDALKEHEMRIKIVKLVDIYLGCASIIYDKDPTAKARRRLYGHSSEHRLPPHGVELRIMGPWSLRSPKTVELTLDLVDHALEMIRVGKDDEVLAAISPDDVQGAINDHNEGLARKVLSQAALPSALMKRVEQDRGALDLYRDWQLGTGVRTPSR